MPSFDFPISGPRTDLSRLLYHRILVSASPVYTGVKPAELFGLHTGDRSPFLFESLLPAAEGYSLKSLVLYRSAGFISVLLYRGDLLQRCLGHPDARDMLRRFGYLGSAADMLGILRERYDLRHYPHEIGLFLGYPPEDVQGYIANSGKNYKLCRYWKVYGSTERASVMFAKIDAARRQTLQHLSIVKN